VRPLARMSGKKGGACKYFLLPPVLALGITLSCRSALARARGRSPIRVATDSHQQPRNSYQAPAGAQQLQMVPMSPCSPAVSLTCTQHARKCHKPSTMYHSEPMRDAAANEASARGALACFPSAAASRRARFVPLPFARASVLRSCAGM
jgi:hypothetical protein